jgi:hypothetical protein
MDGEGTALLKQQQYLPRSGLHCAAAFSEIADSLKSEDFLVEDD